MIVSRRNVLLGIGGTMLARPALAAVPEFQRVASEIANTVADLPGLVRLGSRDADVTLYEFFDYNCPYCKRSAKDVRPLLTGDKHLAYVLVNYAVLGIPSIGATKVALAYAEKHSPEKYLSLHEALFKLHGPVDGLRALGVAAKLGGDRKALEARGDSPEIGNIALAAARLGESLGFQATPSYLAGAEGHGGYLDLAVKRELIANLRQCEKANC
jgi:protein-disulfide isomerase